MKRMLVGVVACAVMLTGCAKSPPQEIPVITPSPISAPSVSPAPPRTSDPAASAQATYSRFTEELTRVFQNGGADDLTAELLAVTGPELQPSVLALVQDTKRRGLRLEGRSRIAIAETIVESPDRVRIVACEDTSANRWLDSSGAEVRLEDTNFFESENTFDRVGSRWQMSDFRSELLTDFSNSERCAHV